MGIVLGLLQILPLLVAGQLSLLLRWPLFWLPPIPLSLLIYLLIPALAGFLTARRRGDDFSESNPGCFVGGIGILIVAIIVPIVSTVVDIIILEPGCPPYCPRFYFDPLAVAQPVLPFFIFCECVAGVSMSSLGGWLGGILGQKRATRSRQSSETDHPIG